MLEIDLLIKKEHLLNVDGRNVKFIEYESVKEGDFLKVCTNDHRLGVTAEYEWIRKNYLKAVFIKQKFTAIKINGQKIKCDILQIKHENTVKNIYFDISQMMENLDNSTCGKTNKDLWEEKAKIIYDKLINEYNFTVFEDDEESLHKKLNNIVSIGFDITYFFGFIFNENNEASEIEKERKKCLSILRKFAARNFLGRMIINDKIIGAPVRIDEIDDIDLVFINYSELEERYSRIVEK